VTFPFPIPSITKPRLKYGFRLREAESDHGKYID